MTEPFGYFRPLPFGWENCAADDEGARPLYDRPPPDLIGAEHRGFRMDYSGLLGQSQAALRHEPGLAEMLRQLERHLTELGRRWYAGDTDVVDEFLQLYCIADDAREHLKSKGEP